MTKAVTIVELLKKRLPVSGCYYGNYICHGNVCTACGNPDRDKVG